MLRSFQEGRRRRLQTLFGTVEAEAPRFRVRRCRLTMSSCASGRAAMLEGRFCHRAIQLAAQRPRFLDTPVTPRASPPGGTGSSEGIARPSPSRPMTEPIRPSAWRRAWRNTALSVSEVGIARGGYQGCPAEVVCGSARQPSMASSVSEPNHQAATPAQAGVICAPAAEQRSQRVHDLVSLLGNVVAAVLVRLERQGGRPRSGQGGASDAEPVPGITGRVHATRSTLARIEEDCGTLDRDESKGRR